MNHPHTTKNLDGYGTPAIEWDKVLDRLGEPVTQAPETGGPNRHTTWLTTINPDGSPHVTPVGALWSDGAFYFTSGQGTRKSQNLVRDARCTLSLATQPFDLVVEGESGIVTDQATLERLAAMYSEEGWSPQVRDGAFYAEFSAPSAGPPPWFLHAIAPRTVFAFGTTDPYGATRFDL